MDVPKASSPYNPASTNGEYFSMLLESAAIFHMLPWIWFESEDEELILIVFHFYDILSML